MYEDIFDYMSGNIEDSDEYVITDCCKRASNSYYDFDGVYVCDKCLEEYMRVSENGEVCCGCGSELDNEIVYEVYGNIYCETCKNSRRINI